MVRSNLNLHIRLRIAKVIGVLFLLAGCQTGEVFISPPLTAHVVDAVTGLPIEGVEVVMWSSELPTARQSGITNRDGTVNLPRLIGRFDSAFPFVSDRVLRPAIARFEKAGYTPRDIKSDPDGAYFSGALAVSLSPRQ